MENKNKNFQFLIDEFRTRISQLKDYSDEDYIIGVVNIANWLFRIRDFEPAFDYLEELSLWRMRAIDEVGQKLFCEIKNIWQILKDYITPNLLSNLGGEHFIEVEEKGKTNRVLRLQRMVEESERFHILDIYHELRRLVEQVYYLSENKPDNLVVFDENDHTTICLLYTSDAADE